MLDTYGRKIADPTINLMGKSLISIGLSPNNVTVISFMIGLSASVAYLTGQEVLAVILLWISGALDAVDGAMARKMNATSLFGCLMDVTFDRLVEIGLIISMFLINPEAGLPLILLCSSIIFSMTVFLTVGALSANNGVKSFRYQAGLAERTEGFLLFTLMILFKSHIVLFAYIFSMIVCYTAIQRMVEAKKIFKLIDAKK
ncbi:CDP-diacylglycerol--glycerol-3-phosphate 3-phosphatidyltransferase [Acetoanaerobium pronyense]|uniref:CDP-diacylglycerol--glycerol-3-phosphate 3-phosphatidyltransferase n=1 Tax=Acetoanaerobium pronyense TaxID=1482736 RepID=A0ABS4KKU0_9FIRM|nr:CDP-alcohol phosphatidyltransferase family protein [Acetoanaerobium pronyense]MBP2028408.1 CDP-diacylglycerol--glycerol-3-phosphate 3-phosphatidyltransferase [Acetoanaerobium pronyense]